MCVWFGVLAVLGVDQHLAKRPACSPRSIPLYAVGILVERPAGTSFLALGSVVLAVTGGEALYTDMGHFGRLPIRVAWFGLVLPALVLNYFGQGALLLDEPGRDRESVLSCWPPDWALIPMVLLATAATVIASQAVISGAFSVTRQAIQLGLPAADADRPHLGTWRPGRSTCRSPTGRSTSP